MKSDVIYEQSAENCVLVELHVPDFAVAKEFYGKLGFDVAWERPPEGSKGYLVLKREKNILCFWGGTAKFMNTNILVSGIRVQNEGTESS